MKKFILIFALLTGLASIANTTSAQYVNVNININSQPAWGPTGYDYVGYYYFPEINCYYDVNGGLFVYYDSGRWISARYLPHRYSRYDLYGTYKVVLNARNPWLNNSYHYSHYAPYRTYRSQVVIRDSRDNRYYSSRNNHVVWYNDSRSNRPYNNNVSRPVNNNNVQRPNNSSGRPSNNQVSRPSTGNNKNNNGQYAPNNNNRKDNNNKGINRPSNASRTNNYQLVNNTGTTTRSSRR